jgi:protein gp37
MGANSAIEWTDHTFNPWWGCVEVSPACDECYARIFAHRLGFEVWGADAPRRFFPDQHWRGPVNWNAAATLEGTRARVFCASMADVFEDREDLDATRRRLWDLIEATPALDWLLLTKRPQAIRRKVPRAWLEAPRSNVWYGVTVETPPYLWRLDALRDVPAARRFISYEPALADVRWNLEGIDWLIAGGLSSPKNHPADPAFIRSARDQAHGAGVAFFFKQWGGRSPKSNGRLLDGRLWSEIPASVTDVSRSCQ